MLGVDLAVVARRSMALRIDPKRRSLGSGLMVVVSAFVACSGCHAEQPSNSKDQKGRGGDLPAWVSTLIGQQPAHSTTVVEESVYQGHRAFLVMPSDRAPDSGNEHVLHAEDGRIICEFGGFAGHVTVGSCDIDGIKYVRTLYPSSQR
jgi:hypothetical protein